MKRLFLMLLLVASTVRADVVREARATATEGDRARALRMLEARLLENPRDHDARTLYGTILSWDRQFARARQELRVVLRENPDHADAQAALARVEQWSADAVNEWSAGANYDDYRGSDPWREGFVALKLATARGPVIARVSRVERFGLDDMQFEAEAYPRISRSDYAFLSVGVAQDGTLYPERRFGAEWFHSFARVWEASLGARRLEFDDPATVYTTSVSRYAGNWLFGGRVYRTEGETSVFAMARRYFGDHGEYAGIRAGRGAREDIRSAADVESLTTSEITAEAFLWMTPRWFLNLRAGAGSERKSLSAAITRRF